MIGRQIQQAPQSLRGHRSLHGVIQKGLPVLHETGHVASRISQVPGQVVHFAVYMARGAGSRAGSGELGIVQKTAARFDRRRRRVGPDRNLAAHPLHGGRDN